MLNLNEFLAELRHNGSHPTNRFDVIITPPKGLVGGNTNLLTTVFNFVTNQQQFNARQLSLRAHSTVFPGRSIIAKETLRYGLGAADKIATTSAYGDIPVSFIVDNQYDVGTLMHKWLNLIQPSDLTTGSLDDNYFVEYKDQYATAITINQYNANGQRTITCKLRDAFPVAVLDTQIAWENNNQITVLPVQFTFNDYKMSTL